MWPACNTGNNLTVRGDRFDASGASVGSQSSTGIARLSEAGRRLRGLAFRDRLGHKSQMASGACLGPASTDAALRLLICDGR
jgi:hypothetical protein